MLVGTNHILQLSSGPELNDSYLYGVKQPMNKLSLQRYSMTERKMRWREGSLLPFEASNSPVNGTHGKSSMPRRQQRRCQDEKLTKHILNSHTGRAINTAMTFG